MEYTRLGRSGLQVSRIGLGCMSYGQATTGLHQWTLDEEAAAPFFQQAVESGVTFWDTANVYQNGTSEEFVGRAINRYSRREDIVLGEAGDLEPSTDRHAELLDPTEEDPLDGALPQCQRVRVPGREAADVQGSAGEAQPLGRPTLGQEPVDDAALVEDLDRS